MKVVTERRTGRIASQLQHHMQVATKCLPTTGRICFSLLLNPLGYMERLWDLCSRGIAEQNFIHFPHNEETLSITLCPLVLRLSSVVFMAPSIHLIWEGSVWVAEEDGKEAYQGPAMGAKMQGIKESLTQKAHSLLRGKRCQREGSFLLWKDLTVIAGPYISSTPLTTVSRGKAKKKKKIKKLCSKILKTSILHWGLLCCVTYNLSFDNVCKRSFWNRFRKVMLLQCCVTVGRW